MALHTSTWKPISCNPGQPVDLAQFAANQWWTGSQRHDLQVHPLAPHADGLLVPAREPESSEWHWGLEWDTPRDICQVILQYQNTPPDDVRIEYWQKNWPTPAPERLSGARRGWIGCDDPWHGRWVTVRAKKDQEGNTLTFSFDPIDLPELQGIFTPEQLENAEHYLARFRRTLKIRAVCASPDPPIMLDIHAYSNTTWQHGDIDIHFGVTGTIQTDWSSQAAATHGFILGATLLDTDTVCTELQHNIWRCPHSSPTAAAGAAGIRLHVAYADCAADSGDRTVITVRTHARDFSFLVNDLHRGPIYIKDYDVYLSWRGGPAFDTFHNQIACNPEPIYERVPREAEHSLARALREIPPLDVTKQNSYTGLGRYLPLSVEAGRQEFALRHNGELFADKVQLKLTGRDASRLLWPGHQIRFRFGTGDPPDFRETSKTTHQSLMEGWLPVVTSRWLDREIAIDQTTFAALLDSPMTNPEQRNGDENIVVLQRFTLRNTTSNAKTAAFWFVISPQEHLQLEEGKILALGRIVPAEPVERQWQVAPYETPLLRSTLDIHGRGDLCAVPLSEQAGLSASQPTAILYTVRLQGGEAHAITLRTPFISLTQSAEWDNVASLDFDEKLAEVVAYWRAYVEGGGVMLLPDTILSDFHKAARTHVAIGVDKDPVSGWYVVPAATWSYGACGNEATWQITMLDQAGHHDRAEAYLETFLQTQGLMRPDGRFSSSEGALLAMNFDAGVPKAGGFGYNLDHGFILECLAQHYRYTQDTIWLVRVLPHLIAACDFITRERQSTMTEDEGGQRNPAWGLLPEGHLEDNPEWRHWFAVNAHAYAGMRAVTHILKEINHPEAQRMTAHAEAYRHDIRTAAHTAMALSPVVQLLDGTYIPHLPTRTGLQGREWGWFREAAYGALHLMEGYVFEPQEEEMTWVLKDLEDNLFVSRHWGRPVNVEKDWFSLGGITIQPNLMDLGIDYLRRGQVKHAIRALFNNFGTSLYSDVRTFTEHPVVEPGHGVGPFYKSPDESKALVWLRHFLLHEQGNSLHLAMGAPRAWFTPGESFEVRNMATLLGAVSYHVHTLPSTVEIEIKLAENHRIDQLIVHLRLPENNLLQSAIVNRQSYLDFHAEKECISFDSPPNNLSIIATYR